MKKSRWSARRTNADRVRKIMSPAAYMRLYTDEVQQDRIEEVRIIPPRLGGQDFGKIEVTFTYQTGSIENLTARLRSVYRW